ncbi:adenylate/guanylate cyclase domain-containing protein [Hymenobacter jejuensis]|uniref:Adenylate/guanylate cyclase domain-containing protein n=1 Tax=Hymenobacter jejuensis TaxID=2502781 RepID=A0A5B8A1Q1_9BACT|nr:adenylate/guanylate cyclase domain-containing protein [Hymenobacter jejuensis]QDA61314.1 adenylate/guanylate cyclase domain-containing protein [Hymenobacter jejuensis]
MKESQICLGCWEHMHMPTVIRGPFSFLFKSFGIKRSQMHPNLCTYCESNFAKIMKHKQIPVSTTILFADIRGYTDLSQQIEGAKVNELLNSFYDRCSAAIWEEDGIVNKFIGDAVLAIFNFPLIRKDHVQNAVSAAVQLQKNCQHLKEEIGLSDIHTLGVGIGIHTGECYMGEVGTTYKDFTAIGPVVNLTSRLQGAAGVGEIMVTEEVFNEVKEQFPDAQKKTLTLKGINNPVTGYVLT